MIRTILGFAYLSLAVTLPGAILARRLRLEELVLRSFLVSAAAIPIAYFFPIAGYAELVFIALGFARIVRKRPENEIRLDHSIAVVSAIALAASVVADRDYVQFYLRYALVVGLTGRYPARFPHRFNPAEPPFVVSGPLEVFLVGSLIRLFGTGFETLYASRALGFRSTVALLYLSRRLGSERSMMTNPGILVALAFTAGLLDPPLAFVAAYVLYGIRRRDENLRIALALLPFVKIRRVALYAIFAAYRLFGLVRKYLPPLTRLFSGVAIAFAAAILGANPLAAVLAGILVAGSVYKALKEHIPPEFSRLALLLALPAVHVIRVTIVSGNPLGEYRYLLSKPPEYREYTTRYIENVPYFALMKELNVIGYFRYSVYYFAPAVPLIIYYALRREPTGVDAFAALALMLLAIPMPRNPRHFLRLRAIVALLSDEEAADASTAYLAAVARMASLAIPAGSAMLLLAAAYTAVSLFVPKVVSFRVSHAAPIIAAATIAAMFSSAYAPIDGYRYHVLGDYFEYLDDVLALGVTGLIYDGAPGLEYFLNASIPAIPLFQPMLLGDLRRAMHAFDPRTAFGMLREYRLNAFLLPYPYRGRRTTYLARYLDYFLYIPYFRVLLGPTYEYRGIDRRFAVFRQVSDELVYGYQGLIVEVRGEYAFAGAIFDHRGRLLACPIYAGMSSGRSIVLKAIFLGDPGNVSFSLSGTLFEANVARLGEFYVAYLEVPEGSRVLEGVVINGELVRSVIGLKNFGEIAYVELSPRL